MLRILGGPETRGPRDPEPGVSREGVVLEGTIIGQVFPRTYHP